MDGIQNNIDSNYTYYDNSVAEANAEKVPDKQNDESYIKTPTVITNGLIDSDSPVCYDKSILQPEHREELLERMLNSMSRANKSEKIVEYDESLGRDSKRN